MGFFLKAAKKLRDVLQVLKLKILFFKLVQTLHMRTILESVASIPDIVIHPF